MLFAKWRLKRDLRIAAKGIRRLERAMAAMGIPRHQRRQMYRDFYKGGEGGKSLFKILTGATK